MAQLRMMFNPEDGSVLVVVPNGLAFEAALIKTKYILKELGAEGAPIKLVGEPEQHKHDPVIVERLGARAQ